LGITVYRKRNGQLSILAMIRKQATNHFEILAKVVDMKNLTGHLRFEKIK